MALRGTTTLSGSAVRLATVAALLLSLFAYLTPIATVSAAPAEQGAFASGTVVSLKGTPHLWFADGQGSLHWGGDTRALAGHDINWNSRVELSFEQVKALPLSDPWLSAGLLKDGDPIYLVKWETNQDKPTLLHIQSIADVEVFGINGRNYGQFVLDRAEWERRFGMSASSLTRAELAPAAPAAPKPGQVLLSDNFDDPAKGILPQSSSDPSRVQGGYVAGEYVLKSVVPGMIPFARLRGSFANASIAVDAHLVGGADGRLILLACRENAEGNREYRLVVNPDGGDFGLWRVDGEDVKWLVERSPSQAIRRGAQTNRLELNCSGSTIAARINGTQVASVQDSSYREGQMWIGAATFKDGITVEAHFDNLVVTQQ